MDFAQLAGDAGEDRLALAVALAERAAWVQWRLDQASELGVAQHEETLTQSVLLDLRARMPDLQVRVFARAEENRATGADWAWWWGGKQNWFGHLVQAKRLQDIGRNRVGYTIGYRPRSAPGEPDRPRQVDTLLEAARHIDVPALYVLYNFSTPGRRRTGPCPYVEPGEAAEGVSVLSADVARHLLDLEVDVTGTHVRASSSLPLSSAWEDARPWSCLASCATDVCRTWPRLSRSVWHDLGFADRPGSKDLAFGAALTVLLARTSPRRRQALDAIDDGQLVVGSIARGVRDAPPREVLQALDDPSDPERAQAAMEELPDSVAGLVVIQERWRG